MIETSEGLATARGKTSEPGEEGISIMTAGVEGKIGLVGRLDVGNFVFKSMRGSSEGKSFNTELMIGEEKIGQLLIVGGEVFPK